jgi:hypothetical protein
MSAYHTRSSTHAQSHRVDLVASNQLIQVDDDELDLEQEMSLDKGLVLFVCVRCVCAHWVCVCVLC